MKYILVILFIVTSTVSALSPEEKKEAKIQAQLAKPFNPLSLILPKDEVLTRMNVSRVMDMGGTSYAQGFRGKALHFYNKVIQLFPNETEEVGWAHYEIAFIYQQTSWWGPSKKKALEHLDTLQGLTGADPVTLRLAQTLATRLNNPKEYRVYRKQEDVLFVQDKRQKRQEDKRIAQEEAAVAKIQAAQRKERRRIEKEEKKAAKEAAKANNVAQKG
ncbi:MAG: hypothetical protein ACRCY4_07810 [Brevinema sp.]